MHPFGIGITHFMAPRNDAETAILVPYCIEVEGQFDRTITRGALVAIRMPNGVTDKVVAIARHIVEIFTQEPGPNGFDALVVEQRAQIGLFVEKGQERRVLLMVVRGAGCGGRRVRPTPPQRPG